MTTVYILQSMEVDKNKSETMNTRIYPCYKPQAEYIVLSSGLGGHGAFWQPQIAALQQYFHVLVYDQAGCHQNSAQLKDDYSLSDMAQELLDLIQDAKIQRLHFIGHALGALIGIELARLITPLKIEMLSLTCINAWDRPDPHTLKCFNARTRLLEYAGSAAYVEAQALFLYPPAWISTHYQSIAEQETKQLQDFPVPANVLARIHALSAFQVTAEHRGALAKTRLHFIANRDDFLVPYQKSEDLKQVLGHGKLSIFNHGAHASTITETEQTNQAILNFLQPSFA
jgi:aminoacrylate hydrolase